MDQNQTKEPRPPINLRIKFRSENVEQFIERYAVDVSRGGIFIRTKDPLAVGTHLKLDFQFQNGNALMAGEGTVVWIREFDPNRTTVPPGMGVRFDKLSPESQTVLEQLLVEKGKRERGGVPGSSQGASTGGIAVRRPSSMFSVLEPQVSVAVGATADKEAATTTTTVPAASSSSGAGAKATQQAGPATGKPETPAPGYRPLGTARNPFSSSTPGPTIPASTTAGAGETTTNPAASTSGSGPRPLADLLPLLSGTPKVATPPATSAGPVANAGAADADGSFDDMNEEPTQIAGRLPSFLTSDSEATTEVPPDLAESVKTAPPLPLDFLPGASPDSARPGARPKQSLDEAPPAGSTVDAVSPTVPQTEAPKVDGGGAAVSTTNVAAPVTADVATVTSAPAAATAAKPGAPAKKRSALPVVAAVLVLGGSAIFLSRFFGSQSSEDVTQARPAPAALPVVTGEPMAPPAPAAAEPAPAVAPPPAAEAPPAPPVAPPPEAAAAKPASPPPPEAAAEAPRKSAAKKKARADVPAPEADPAAAGTTGAAPTTAPADATDLAPVHQIRVTSKPSGADVTLDGQSVGKTPFSVGIADVNAPHSISVRKDGFEPFEQAIGVSSPWSKSKGPKDKPPLMVLKVNAKLKPVGGAAESKPSTEPPPPQEGDSAAAARPDRPLPPTDVTPPADSPPPP